MTNNATCSINDLFRSGNRKLAPSLLEIIDDLSDYHPLTVRQVYYQAVSHRLIENALAEYQNVSRVLMKLRENDLLAWETITDRSRRLVDKRGVSNVQTFAQDQLAWFLDPRAYHRCLVQDQEVYIEVSTEKDALAGILEEAIWMYCTRLNVVRGQASATWVEQMSRRYSDAIMRGQRPILVHFGDLDPSGVVIPRVITRKLADVHGVEVELVRAALSPEQVEEYNLPECLTAAKEKDPNYKAWVAEYGEHQAAVECDALHPKDLTDILQNTLSGLYDVPNMNEHLEVERSEILRLKRVKREATNMLRKRFPDLFAA